MKFADALPRNRKARRAAASAARSPAQVKRCAADLGHSVATVASDLSLIAGDEFPTAQRELGRPFAHGARDVGHVASSARVRGVLLPSHLHDVDGIRPVSTANGGLRRKLFAQVAAEQDEDHDVGAYRKTGITHQDAEDLVDGKADSLLARIEGDHRYSEAERASMRKVVAALQGLSARAQAAVLESVERSHGKVKLGSPGWLSASEAIVATAELARTWELDAAACVDRMEPELRRLSREWHAPPGQPRSAVNLELLAMNVIRWMVSFGKLNQKHCGASLLTDAVEERKRVEIMVERDPVFFKCFSTCGDFVEKFAHGEAEDNYSAFGQAWLESSFARLEVGHKLAASLCLTDIPDDMEVKAPWGAWSLVVPDGLFPPLVDGGEEKPARFWCLGTQPVFIIANTGRILQRADHPGGPVYDAIMSLLKGACLALSNPEDFRKERQHRPSARATKHKRDAGSPDFEQARFLLSSPVKIDLREHLGAVLSGRKGSSPTVQFLVRGHWTNQAHGPRMSLRKKLWINPFWKGPEDTRILLRQVKVDE